MELRPAGTAGKREHTCYDNQAQVQNFFLKIHGLAYENEAPCQADQVSVRRPLPAALLHIKRQAQVRLQAADKRAIHCA
ncbi:hypothetical protein [Massilia sp.]|uniref:hypothetical protein n=1 Tax=Massilia sp. TaxID=1882437 RepID=UPI0028AC70BF|nr:hypothetical protein [Massilia sp.]